MLIDDLMEYNPNAKIVNTVTIGYSTKDENSTKSDAEYIAINYDGGEEIVQV